jgi:hypothetical protein
VEHHLLHLSTPTARSSGGSGSGSGSGGGGGGGCCCCRLRPRDGVWGDGKAREGIEASGWAVACSCSLAGEELPVVVVVADAGLGRFALIGPRGSRDDGSLTTGPGTTGFLFLIGV